MSKSTKAWDADASVEFLDTALLKVFLAVFLLTITVIFFLFRYSQWQMVLLLYSRWLEGQRTASWLKKSILGCEIHSVRHELLDRTFTVLIVFLFFFFLFYFLPMLNVISKILRDVQFSCSYESLRQNSPRHFIKK